MTRQRVIGMATVLILAAAVVWLMARPGMLPSADSKQDQMMDKSVLSELDTANLVEYDRESDTVIISPIGIKCVEEEILRGPVKAVANHSLKRTSRKWATA